MWKLKVTNYSKQPTCCAITTSDLFQSSLVNKGTHPTRNSFGCSKFISWLLTISLKFFWIWIARRSPLDLSFSKLQYNLCRTLSGASSERSKTYEKCVDPTMRLGLNHYCSIVQGKAHFSVLSLFQTGSLFTCDSLRSSRYVLIRLLPSWPPLLELMKTTTGQDGALSTMTCSESGFSM